MVGGPVLGGPMVGGPVLGGPMVGGPMVGGPMMGGPVLPPLESQDGEARGSWVRDARQLRAGQADDVGERRLIEKTKTRQVKETERVCQNYGLTLALPFDFRVFFSLIRRCSPGVYIHTYIHIYIYTHTYTHTNVYIYIYAAGRSTATSWSDRLCRGTAPDRKKENARLTEKTRNAKAKGVHPAT